MQQIIRSLSSSEKWFYVFVGILSASITWLVLQLRVRDFLTPFEYSGDALAVGAHVKTTLENGWYEFEPRLGFPAGQTYNDFPTADNLHLLIIKLTSVLTDNWAIAMNLYYFAGFILAAISAAWLFRTIGLPKLLSIALSLSFALAPYHFQRGESHLWLASYFAIPLALGLLVKLLLGEKLWTIPDSKRNLITVLRSQATFTLLTIALLASSSSYYAIFFLVFLTFTAVGVWIRYRSSSLLRDVFLVFVATLAVMLINMTPDLLFSLENGRNEFAVSRSRAEAEIYALKLSQLLLPWLGHRIDFLANLRKAYSDNYPLLSENPALGMIAASGLVLALMLIATLALSWPLKPNRKTLLNDPRALLFSLSGLIYIALIFSTVGGVSTLISGFTDLLRGWNRMSIYISALSLAVVGLTLVWTSSKARLKFKSKRLRLVASVILATAMISVSVIDQTPADAASKRTENADRFKSDAAWVERIESVVPQNAPILQLPYLPFPEGSSTTGVLASDVLIPFLHTDSLRFSGGGIKGRPRADYVAALQLYSPKDISILAAASDFEGILVDTAAIPNRGLQLIAGLSQTLGNPTVTSPDNRYLFYDLGPVKSELRLNNSEASLSRIKELITNPIFPYAEGEWSTNLSPETGFVVYDAKTAPATLTLRNDLLQPVAGILEVDFVSAAHDHVDIQIESLVQPARAGQSKTGLIIEMIAPPGGSEVTFEDSKPVSLKKVRFVPNEVQTFLNREAEGW